VPDTDKELKRDLECLRLASDLLALSRGTLDPDLRAHCARMAGYWSGEVDRDPKEDPASLDDPA
jgi:hypothetical protein